MNKRIAYIVIASIIASMIALPVLYAQSSQSNLQRGGSSQESAVPSISYAGEVTYQIHGGKAGRIAPASTNATALTLMPTDMQVVIFPVCTVRVLVTLSIELAVTADYPVGILAVVDTTRMYPSVGGPGSSYLSGYVAHPRVGSIGNYARLETWTFTWELTVSTGTRTIRFYWAIASGTARVWGDFYSVSVWATRVNP